MRVSAAIPASPPVAEARRAKPLRCVARPIDLARAEPIPDRLLDMPDEGRKNYGLDMFEDSGLSKRAYWRESGHESWTHARSLVTPRTERIPTPWDLHVLEKVLFVLSVAPPRAILRRVS